MVTNAADRVTARLVSTVSTTSSAFPNSEDAQALGLDPVFPPSICVAFDRVNFGLVSSLIGRNEKASRYVDQQGVPYQRRCNNTYTGIECCGSCDGMVWLK